MSDTGARVGEGHARPEEERPVSQPSQQQQPPGSTTEMTPKPDHGEESYRGSGRMAGKATIITGADSTSHMSRHTRSSSARAGM